MAGKLAPPQNSDTKAEKPCSCSHANISSAKPEIVIESSTTYPHEDLEAGIIYSRVSIVEANLKPRDKLTSRIENFKHTR